MAKREFATISQLKQVSVSRQRKIFQNNAHVSCH